MDAVPAAAQAGHPPVRRTGGARLVQRPCVAAPAGQLGAGQARTRPRLDRRSRLARAAGVLCAGPARRHRRWPARQRFRCLRQFRRHRPARPGRFGAARQCRAQSHAQVPGIGPAGAGRAAGGQRRPRRRPGLSHRPLRPGTIAGQPAGHGAGWWVRAKLALRQGDSVRPRRPMPAPPPRSRAPMAASTPTARDACGPNRAC